MRYSASDKTEISGWSSNHIWRLDARWRNSAFPDRPYRWYDQYQRGDRKPSRIDPHGRIGSGTVSEAIRRQIVDLALDQPELSPRELAVRFTDEQEYFVLEA
jgi:putative transposase